MHYWLPLVALIACDDTDPGNGLLSASRISLAERESARIHVAVATIEDFTIDAPAGITVAPVADGVGPGFDVTATCDAARGQDADLVVRVHDRTGNRDAALVISVADDKTEACAAAISMWIEACDMTPCEVACTPGSAQPATTFTLGKAQRARVCVTAEALDTSRPLANEVLAIEPMTSGFEPGPASGTTRSLILRGADWLVGPYQIRYDSVAGTIPVSQVAPLDIGADTDIGIELQSSAASLPKEFARTVIPFSVHRFPNATPACTLSLTGAMDAPLGCAATDARLYDGNGLSVGRCTAMACGNEAHAAFTIGYVPRISSTPQETIPINVDAGVGFANATAIVDVTSRAENLPCANADRIACADVDGDGALEVLASNSSGESCLVSMPGWRQLAQTVAALANVRVLAVARPAPAPPEILAIDGAGDVFHLVRNQVAIDSWQWLPFLTGRGAPADVVPIRSGTSGPPNFLVGTIAGTPSRARFVSLDGVVAGGDVSLGLDGEVTIGAITEASGAQQLGILRLNAALLPSPEVSLLTINWSTPPPKAGTPSPAVGTGLPQGARYAIVGRSSPAADDVLALSYGGPFSSGVAELSGSPLVVGTSYGAIRSLAAVPDGSVLLGAAGGSQQTLYDSMVGVSYRSIDPLPQAAPDQQYGNVIAPCFDAAGSAAGFVVQTSAGMFRAAQILITPESP